MRAWQIIVVSAVVASIAAAGLFLPGAARLPDGAASLLRTYWPGAAIVWLAVYSVMALVLSTAAAVRDLGGAEAGPAGMDWARRYLWRLGVAQYFSAILALVALGLLPVTVATEPLFPIPAAIGPSPALTACAAAILVGVLGWLIVTIVATFRAPPVLASSPIGPDTQLLREIIGLLRARPAEPVPASAEITEQLRQRDHSTLEAIKELAGAMSRIRNGIFEVQQVLQQRASEQVGQSGSTVPADAEAVGELRALTASLTSVVARLEDIAAGLAAIPAIGLSSPARGNLPPGSRSQLSTELQELLRDMAPGAVPRQEGPR
jgi:hypothetical protein